MPRQTRPFRIEDVMSALGRLADPALAQEWDNVGLIAGDERAATVGITTTLPRAQETPTPPHEARLLLCQFKRLRVEPLNAVVFGVRDVDPPLAVYSDSLGAAERPKLTAILAKLIEEEEAVGDLPPRDKFECTLLTQHALIAAIALAVHQDDFQSNPLSAVTLDRETLRAQLALSFPQDLIAHVDPFLRKGAVS